MQHYGIKHCSLTTLSLKFWISVITLSKDLLRTHTQCCIVLKIIHLCWKIRKI